MASIIARGRGVVEALARRFPQLYVAPAEGAQEAHAFASRHGVVSGNMSLGHFDSSESDELRVVETPAGPVDVAFFENRTCFETFLQIIGHKSEPVPIARTIGAVTYRGLADWGAVADARTAYLEAGGEDWGSEFARQAKQPGAFRAEIVVVSEGPYSNVDAADTSFDKEEWIRVSREIRLHHECAHVVCRRTMPEDVLPVWDEVTADVVGLISATGSYDAALASRFLGVAEQGFVGGRLSEYLADDQAEAIDDVASEVYGAILEIERLSRAADRNRPFDFLVELKKDALLAY